MEELVLYKEQKVRRDSAGLVRQVGSGNGHCFLEKRVTVFAVRKDDQGTDETCINWPVLPWDPRKHRESNKQDLSLETPLLIAVSG